MLLTACEWLDVFVDQQRQVRRADRKNGTWHLKVHQSGTYRLELRRWPRESGLKLTASVPETVVTDGTFVAGKSLPIASARVQVAGHDVTLDPDPSGKSFTAEMTLSPGPVQLTTTFVDAEGEEICGAYYVYVEALGTAEE